MSTDKFKNKYRIPSARAQWWDYGNNAAYFVTICTADRECYFGETEIGQTATHFWNEIPKRFPFVDLGEFIVMPNHIHGIIVIDKKYTIQKNTKNGGDNVGGFAKNKNPMLHDNLSHILKWYKGRCTFEIRKIHADFAWQSRFHDRIIRNEKEYKRIADYITNNPANWDNDEFHTK